MVLVPDTIEGRDPVITARHRLPVDDAGPRAQLGQRLDNEREAVSQVIARPAIEPHPHALLAGDNPEASCLISYSQPLPEGGRGADVGRHGSMKPAGKAGERNGTAG
jgi:hypothetical protein